MSVPLKDVKARVRSVAWRGALDWANPDLPYTLVEGHEVVLVHWPTQSAAPEEVRWWVSACLHLFESARRSRVKALGFCLAEGGDGLLAAAGQFLATYVGQLEATTFVAADTDSLLQEIEAHYAQLLR